MSSQFYSTDSREKALNVLNSLQEESNPIDKKELKEEPVQEKSLQSENSNTEDLENWLRDLIQKYTKDEKGIPEIEILKSGKPKYSSSQIKQSLKELSDDDYIQKQGNKWVWVEASAYDEQDDEQDDNPEKEFAEWFNEQMKQYEFDEGLFDGVKNFIGAAKDIAAGAKAGVTAKKSGKSLGDVLSITGTQMKANTFQRAYKEMWLGFNKGLKIMNPKLQAKIASSKQVRDSVNSLLGSIVEALENGKVLKLADAAKEVIPVGTNPEQDEARREANKGNESSMVAGDEEDQEDKKELNEMVFSWNSMPPAPAIVKFKRGDQQHNQYIFDFVEGNDKVLRTYQKASINPQVLKSLAPGKKYYAFHYMGHWRIGQEANSLKDVTE